MINDTKPTVIELFAGAGLLSEAFRQVGGALTAAYELDPLACASYSKNIGNHIQCRDLSKMRPTGNCDILVAGPPCQGFSTLGKRDPNDPRNELSLVVPKWARTTGASVVVVENVAAFNGTAIHSRLAKSLRRIEYQVETFVLKATDYGCAQHRRRSFTIASKSDSGTIKPRRRRSKSVSEAWIDMPASQKDYVMSYYPEPSELALSRFRVTPAGGDKRAIMNTAPHLAASSWWTTPNAVTDVWGRMNWDHPSNTLRTSFQNPSKGRYVHPVEHRVISLREGARLQGIPDRWQMEGHPTAIARQIGNGVPIPLGRVVARCALQAVA